MNVLLMSYIALAIIGLYTFPAVRYRIGYGVGFIHGFFRGLRGRRP